MIVVKGYNRRTGEQEILYRCETARLASAFIRRYDDFNGNHHYLSWYGPGDGRTEDDDTAATVTVHE